MVLDCLDRETESLRKDLLAQGTLDMPDSADIALGIWASTRESGSRFARDRVNCCIDAESLYPALHRVERQGLVTSEWKMSDNNQRARYYRLTAAGRKHLVPHKYSNYLKSMAARDWAGSYNFGLTWTSPCIYYGAVTSAGLTWSRLYPC